MFFISLFISRRSNRISTSNCSCSNIPSTVEFRSIVLHVTSLFILQMFLFKFLLFSFFFLFFCCCCFFGLSMRRLCTSWQPLFGLFQKYRAFVMMRILYVTQRAYYIHFLLYYTSFDNLNCPHCKLTFLWSPLFTPAMLTITVRCSRSLYLSCQLLITVADVVQWPPVVCFVWGYWTEGYFQRPVSLVLFSFAGLWLLDGQGAWG